MKHRTRTKFAAAAIAAVAATLLTACTSGGSSSSSGSSSTLSLWARSDDSPFIKPLVEAYNKSHKTKVSLTIVPAGASFTQKLGAAVGSGSAPDLVSLNLVYAPYFAAAGQLLDVTAQAKKLSDLSKLNKSEINLGTWDGKLYSMPFTGDASVLFYNKDLFKKAGLDPNKPPTSWAEMETDAKKITALGGGNYGYYFPGSGSGWNLFTFTPYIWANGGDVLSGTGSSQKPTLTSPAVKNALAFYRRLWTDGVIPKSAQTDDGTSILSLFEAGKVGMLANGAFAYSDMKTKFPNLNYGVTAIPGSSGGSASFAGGDTLAIMKQTKNASAAWAFETWATSKSVQQKYIAGAGVVPIREDAVPTNSNANFKALVKAMADGRTPKSTVYSQLFENPNGPWANLIHNSVFKGDINQEASSAQAQWATLLSSGQ